MVGLAVLLLPAAGQTRIPPESDGSTYSWPAASIVTTDVAPWGGGYVRSDPYLIDCPLACIRPFDKGRTVSFRAFPTPGFTFKGWEGPCAGQSNPCTLTLDSSAVEVVATFSGFYVPPAPPAPPAPAISVTVSGACPSCTISVVGTGFAPSSSIDLAVDITSPPLGSFTVPGFATTDANGVWSVSPSLPCDFGSGPYVGPFEEDVTATDSTGRSASTHVSATCV